MRFLVCTFFFERISRIVLVVMIVVGMLVSVLLSRLAVAILRTT
ncbi:hypothetical protein LEP1GSC150_2088 [Leptospira interrogans serovar Copenhageni str. LT2050]|uniref:Uncharacterized protein n=1 Tax=Leptospira interrogans serovar Copenhageni str. LT2050 TaxID=1001598 RepID=M3IRW7_LEPIT|nr:hypothetical protein LEP1GSC150_2088 [Leptospira interrogans serovar Copenhageni str. LT2050]